MSTKSPIVRGAKFELFKDWHEQENVMLKLERVRFDSDKDSVTVHIPIALWEFLRTIPAESTEAAALTDAQLLAKAEELVNETIANWKAREHERRKLPEKRRRFLRNIFGGPDRPRHVQLRETVGRLLGDRDSARQLLRQIAVYRQETYPEAQRKRDEAHSQYWKKQHKKWEREKAVQKRRDEVWQRKQEKRVDKILSLKGSRAAEH